MFANRRNWFSGFGSRTSRNPHSLDQLKYLYTVMSKNQTVTEQNKTLLVETLRSISEILIWGDQNDSSVFDFFLEKNMLSFFLRIMKQKCGSYVCVQLLQTLNILFENIRNETSLYYLLSNNHVNCIIEHKFDFSDEEVMAYYISFLKTLSLKLNPHTIHFFFNETTNDFPLYTEAIKFFNHSEKMVRIAVRTLTLNVFRVEEQSMLKFITDRTAVPYFSNLVWFIGNHVLNIDNCLHGTGHHSQQTVVRLDDLVAEHLDHLHYLNDILLLNIPDLNAILTEHLLNRLLIPLYIFSLIEPASGSEPKIRLSRLVSLFLLSQVFLIISYEPLVQQLLNVVQSGNMSLFSQPEFTPPAQTLEQSLTQAAGSHSSHSEEDEGLPPSDVSNMTEEDEPEAMVTNESCDSNSEQNSSLPLPASDERDTRPITDEEKAAAVNESLTSVWTNSNNVMTDRPFLEALFQCLDCRPNSDDHTFIFALCLLYAIVHNKGLSGGSCEELFLVSCSDSMPQQESTCNRLIGRLIQLMHLCCQYNSRIRLVTLEMSIMLLQKLVMRDGKSLLSDQWLASVEQAKEEAASIVRNLFRNEDETIFLDLFEEEYAEMQNKRLNVEYLMMDANLLLPPNQLTSLLMNGVELRRRLPCADVERTRYAIRVFFLMRELSFRLRGEEETQLPLEQSDKPLVKVDQLLDLNTGDLIACTVFTKEGRIRRFMVIDSRQLILIEPDSKKLGFGVTKFVALIQDVEVTVDKEDNRSLHLTIREQHKPTASGRPSKRAIALAAKFTFDDHIRCMAAKQRLTKGRTKARQRKMLQIAKLIELGTHPFAPPARRLRSHVSSIGGEHMTRSHSQEGFNRRSASRQHPDRVSHVVDGQMIMPRSSIPGLAVPDVGSPKGHHRTGQMRASGGPVPPPSKAVSTRRVSQPSDCESAMTSSQESRSGTRRAAETIAMEDMSPKMDRRSSRCRNTRDKPDELTLTESSETV